MQTTRREFMKLLGGGAAAAMAAKIPLPSLEPAEPIVHGHWGRKAYLAKYAQVPPTASMGDNLSDFIKFANALKRDFHNHVRITT